MTADSYAAAVRDETWIGGRLVDTRLSHGHADESRGEIIASDLLSDRTLLDQCEAEAARVREIAGELRDARVRIVVRATTDEPLFSTVGISIGNLSIVTTPQFALADASMLRNVRTGFGPPRPDNVVSTLPIVWRNGTAAILLHEAAGHAAEHHHPPLAWPSWLRARDGDADLLAGEAPRTLRRESFRDVPMPRMMNVVVEQRGAPFSMPDRCVIVDLIGGGAYEPLTGMVTIDVAVASIDEDRIAPFTIRALRARIAASILGAAGDPIRYPGVICSREGQELFVGSHAPVIVTAALS